jgi:hypothetical protein
VHRVPLLTRHPTGSGFSAAGRRKPRRGRYVSGERGWIKTKNRDYWRWELEREGVLNRRRERQFV